MAQYFQVREKNDISQAKTKYLNFLKAHLLENTSEPEYQGIVSQLKLRTQERTFSEIASQLEYPRLQ